MYIKYLANASDTFFLQSIFVVAYVIFFPVCTIHLYNKVFVNEGNIFFLCPTLVCSYSLVSKLSLSQIIIFLHCTLLSIIKSDTITSRNIPFIISDISKLYN